MQCRMGQYNHLHARKAKQHNERRKGKGLTRGNLKGWIELERLVKRASQIRILGKQGRRGGDALNCF